ncbi:leucine-rich repeat flightless-interacting protein 1 isoform X8 [Athene cunicularia]|uniref:leucine-rich repeat flightless-interacting protein 1 isoform X8 n=1 Tax=Athene cunicularia TaxID=194338 RepID=UPI000EF6A767|nr:leucine-rich repeat flightless-interacting protein 1 isoform X8 [Athene cunicularia]
MKQCVSCRKKHMAEARLAAKRAARAEAREIRMKELERQQKEIYQVQKKYYGLDTKWGDIEQWMEDSERYSRRARRNASASDEDERMSVGSRGSLRSHLEYASTYPVAGLENERTKKKNYSKATNGYEEDVYGSSQSRKSSRPSLLYSDALPARSYRASVYDESVYSGSRRYSASSSRAPSEYSCYLGSGSRASSRASSARASPVIEERPEKDFEKGARTVSSLSAATLASLGGTSSRRGSGDTSISADTEASIREIKDSLAEVEEKYKKAMVSNAQLDNEKTNFMYQVDTLKDALLELEEQLAESRRQYEEKSKEFEREKHAHSILQFQFMEIKEALKQREEMLAKHGIIPDSDVATNGETLDILDNKGHLDSSKTVPGTTQALKTGGDGMLGKANEVDMKNEILEDMGKREIFQNTEREEHKEESEEQEVQTLHADENAKAEKMVEERDALSTVNLPDSRFTEQIQSLTEYVSGNASSSDASDMGDLRKETEFAGTALQQPVSTEAEWHGFSASTDWNSEVGSLQAHQVFETPQEMPRDLGTEHELEKASPEQEEREDLKATSDNEMNQEGEIARGSCELVSKQAELPEVTAAGSLSEEVNVESHAEGFQHSEEHAENKVTNVLGEELVESKDCTDGRTDKTGGDRAGEENGGGNAVQGQMREMDSVSLERTESCKSGIPADRSEKEGGRDQARIRSVSSEDSLSAAPEEQNTQDETELEDAMAEKDRQKEIVIEELELCSDSAETGEQDKASVEAVGCVTEVKGSVLQQAEPDTGDAKEMATQETSLGASLVDDKNKDSELETGEDSGKGKESRKEWVEDLESKAEVETIQCSEETTGDTVGEKKLPLEGEAQNVVKQEEGESKEESTADVSVTTDNKVDKETLKENEQELELASHYGGGFASEEGADNSLAQKTEQDENVSEQVKLEGQAGERLEDDGDAFDFDEESKQILETDEKCNGEKADTQKEEGNGANGAVGKTAQTDEAGERTDKIETEDALTEDGSLQHKKGDELDKTGCLQEETGERTDVMEDEIKASVSNKVEKVPDENVSEQELESTGNNRDESREDLQGGRRGKGKSRDDCTIS